MKLKVNEPEIIGLKKGPRSWALILAPSENYQVLPETKSSLYWNLQVNMKVLAVWHYEEKHGGR